MTQDEILFPKGNLFSEEKPGNGAKVLITLVNRAALSYKYRLTS